MSVCTECNGSLWLVIETWQDGSAEFIPCFACQPDEPPKEAAPASQAQILTSLWIEWLTDPYPAVDPFALSGERSHFVSDRTALEIDPQPKSIPPASVRRLALTPEEKAVWVAPFDRPERTVAYRTNEDGTATRVPVAECKCEQDERALLLYRSIEYGFELSDDVLEWLPEAVADIERACPAPVHYHETLLSEWLAQDVETDADDYEASAMEFWLGQDEDSLTYLQRTEMGGRFMEAVIEAADGADERTVAGMRGDTDTNDWTTMMRSREFTKREELVAAMRLLGIRPRDAAPWVKARIEIKRADAIRAKQEADKASWWTIGTPLPPEGDLRLRAYASCLASLRGYAVQDGGWKLSERGRKAIFGPQWEPVVTTRYREEPTRGLTPSLAARMKRQLPAQLLASRNETLARA